MGHATIPAPTETDVRLTRIAIQNSMDRGTLDEALEEIIAVQAQQAAEIRFLRNLLHNHTK